MLYRRAQKCNIQFEFFSSFFFFIKCNLTKQFITSNNATINARTLERELRHDSFRLRKRMRLPMVQISFSLNGHITDRFEYLCIDTSIFNATTAFFSQGKKRYRIVCGACQVRPKPMINNAHCSMLQMAQCFRMNVHTMNNTII